MSTPTLPDDRVEKMRLTVMHRVERDVARRGRRARTVAGLSLATLVVAGVGGYALSTSSENGFSISSGSSAGSAADSSGAGGAASRSDLKAESDGVTQGDEKAPGPDTDRQVVTTGSATVTVRSPRDAAQRLSTWVESIGGRVDARAETGSGDDASASMTVRVPSDRVTATIDHLATYGRVDGVTLTNDDVTSQAQDLDARIDALRLSIDRLESILARAATSSEVIKAEDALTQRQEQLESLQAQRKGLADQVSLSSLTIDLVQKGQVGSVEPGGFTGGLRDGWNALVSTVNAVVEVVGVLLPWLLVGIVAAGIGRLVARRPRRP